MPQDTTFRQWTISLRREINVNFTKIKWYRGCKKLTRRKTGADLEYSDCLFATMMFETLDAQIAKCPIAILSKEFRKLKRLEGNFEKKRANLGQIARVIHQHCSINDVERKALDYIDVLEHNSCRFTFERKWDEALMVMDIQTEPELESLCYHEWKESSLVAELESSSLASSVHPRTDEFSGAHKCVDSVLDAQRRGQAACTQRKWNGKSSRKKSETTDNRRRYCNLWVLKFHAREAQRGRSNTICKKRSEMGNHCR